MIIRKQEARPATAEIGTSPTFGRELWISSPPVNAGADRYQIDVAFNFVRNEYLVVWQNNWPGSKDIYARRVAANRQLRSWFSIIAGGSNYIQPAVAFNAADGEYLVAWEFEYTASDHDILGRRLKADGTDLSNYYAVSEADERHVYGKLFALYSLALPLVLRNH